MDAREQVEFWTSQVRDPAAHYEACKVIDNYPGPGTFALASLRVQNRYWVRERQAFYEPLSNFSEIYEAASVNAQLAEGGAPSWALDHLVVNMRIFQSAGAAAKGRLTIPTANDAEVGVHSVALCGLTDSDGGELCFRNSWGPRWGDNGYGSMSREYVDRYLVEAWLRRNTRYGPSLTTFPRLQAAETPEAFARTWMCENVRWQRDIKHRGTRHRVCVHDTLSVTGKIAEILEVRDGRGFRLAWAHLFHLGGRSVLKELYVWPSCRRMGYGRLLEDLACERARGYKSSQLQAFVYEMDLADWQGAPAWRFGRALGYSWDVKECERPCTAAIGEKALSLE